jgi:hypothetical protein
MRLPLRLSRGGLRTQQTMVELADRLEAALRLLVVAQPAPHLGNLFAAQAELPGASAGIPTVRTDTGCPSPGTFRAAPDMANDTLEKRTPQKLPGDRQAANKLRARERATVCFINPEESQRADHVNTLPKSDAPWPKFYGLIRPILQVSRSPAIHAKVPYQTIFARGSSLSRRR